MIIRQLAYTGLDQEQPGNGFPVLGQGILTS